MSKTKIKSRKSSAGKWPSLNSRALISILILAFIAYGNSIPNDYNIDDAYVVSLDSANELSSQGIAAIPKILTSRYNEGKGVTVGYRPLGKVTMAIEYSLWGNDPHASHLVNVLFFACCAFLLFLFLRRTSEMLGYKNNAVIFVAVALFILHPIHTEVVCSIKNREEILAFIFLLLAMLSFSKSGNMTWRRGIFIGLMLLLAYWSKETSKVALGVFPLIAWLRNYASGKSSFIASLSASVKERKNIIAFGIAALVFLLVFVILPKSFLPPQDAGAHFEQIPYKFFPAAHIIPNGCRTLIFYLGKLFIPVKLGFYYGYDMLPDTGWNSRYTIAGLGLILIVLGWIVWLIRKQQRAFELFWLLFFVITLLPLLNFIPLLYITGTVAERLVFISSAGFCVLLAHGLFLIAEKLQSNFKDEKWSSSKITYSLAILIVIPFLILTVQRNTHWKDKLTLYEHDIAYLDKSARAHLMLGNSYMKQAERLPNGLKKNSLVQKSKRELTKAIEVYPNYDHAWFGLGIIHTRYRDKLDSAIICLENVREESLGYYPLARETLGDLYQLRLEDTQAALEYYKDAFKVDPTNKLVYEKIMDLCFKMNNYTDIMIVAESVEGNGWEEPYIDMGDAMLRQVRIDEAIDYYLMALRAGHRGDQIINMVEGQLRTSGDEARLIELQQILAQ